LISHRHHQGSRPANVVTVSELNRRIKQILEQDLSFVWISGEVSNLRVPSSGHAYFTLKDNQSQLSAVLFKGQARRLTFRLEDGLVILGLGRVSVYEPRGTYQIIFEHLEPHGLGDLQLAFEQLKHKLSDEGLFDQKHKKKLPSLPKRIHIITSPIGAVIHDTISIIRRRFANMPVILIPTAVQGLTAPAEIVAAIQVFNQQTDAEVAILARGGGSLEDLNAFNEESVARAIHHSKLPIVAAIGHETDFTIADFIADLRAPTPSAAAELVVPKKQDLVDQINALQRRMMVAARSKIALDRRHLIDCRERLVDPRRKIFDGRLYLDDLNHRLATSFQRTLHGHQQTMLSTFSRLMQNPLRNRLRTSKRHNKQLNDNLLYFIKHHIKIKKWVIRNMASSLEALSPNAVLKRGYSITRALPQRSIVNDARLVNLNDAVEITLASGRLQCRIEGKENDGEKKL
jgi:exodeoxyribonuclease VII large subunit